MTTAEAQTEVRLRSGAERISPLTIPAMMPTASAAALAMRHGLKGPTFTVSAACAAGAHAIGTSLRLIQTGEADAVVTGGAEATLTPTICAAFDNMGATSRCGISRPFDARRDGFILSEGAGMLVLEDAGVAAARGAEVVGRVLGYGATVDGYHLTAPEPSARSCIRAITAALNDAGIAPGDLDYVNAHGTSTPLNDRLETKALKAALGVAAERLPVSSTKSAIGHPLGAAGAVEAVATVIAIRRRTRSSWRCTRGCSASGATRSRPSSPLSAPRARTSAAGRRSSRSCSRRRSGDWRVGGTTSQTSPETR